MSKFMKKSRKYIFCTITFGLAGLLLAPIVMYLIKAVKRYPKVFEWMTIAIFAFIGIYAFLFKQEWDVNFIFICICMVMAVDRVLSTNRK